MLDPNSVFRILIKPQLNLSLWVKSLCPIRQLHHTTLSLGVPEAPPLYHVYHLPGPDHLLTWFPLLSLC